MLVGVISVQWQEPEVFARADATVSWTQAPFHGKHSDFPGKASGKVD